MINTPTIITSYLVRYLRSIMFTDKHLPSARIALKHEWKLIQEEYTYPTLEYLSERNKDFIRQQYKRLHYIPIHEMPETLEINAIVLLELYTTVSNVKGDKGWLLREFKRQYQFVYSAIKYGRIRT